MKISRKQKFIHYPDLKDRVDISIIPNDPTRPGYWEDEYKFISYLRWICADNSNQNDGLYLLNLEKRQAERLLE
jgi:hypothetical protein